MPMNLQIIWEQLDINIVILVRNRNLMLLLYVTDHSCLRYFNFSQFIVSKTINDSFLEQAQGKTGKMKLLFV